MSLVTKCITVTEILLESSPGFVESTTISGAKLVMIYMECAEDIVQLEDVILSAILGLWTLWKFEMLVRLTMFTLV